MYAEYKAKLREVLSATCATDVLRETMFWLWEDVNELREYGKVDAAEVSKALADDIEKVLDRNTSRSVNPGHAAFDRLS